MKRNKKRNRVLFLLILLLGISIGYALLSTQLKINGIANIKKNTWNIYWDNIANEQGVTPSTETKIPQDDNTLVEWSVNFDKPGDYYEFEVDAVNAGTIDAEILEIIMKYDDKKIVEEPTEEDEIKLPDYFKYTIKYADNTKISVGDGLAKAIDENTPTKKTYKIRVEYDKDKVTNKIVNDMNDDEEHSFSLEVKYGQAENLVGALPCPGKNCVYDYYTSYKYTIKENYDSEDSEDPEAYILTTGTKDYTTLLKNGEQRKVFLGHILNNNNQIERAFTCGIKGNELFCIEGSDEKYEINTTILQKTWNNTCQGDDELHCSADEDKLKADIDNTGEIGIVYIDDNDYYGCSINYTGTINCDDE